ncbi:MAG: ABC transporter permease, partial [Nitrososphaerales archaeon]
MSRTDPAAFDPLPSPRREQLAAQASARVKHRSPRWDDYKRTWYFFRRNTLALVGLGIIILLVALALYALTTSLPWYSLALYCGGTTRPAGCSNYVCTYVAGTTPPHPGCYAVPSGYAGFVAPTISLSPLGIGPLPLGSLTVQSGSNAIFYNVGAGLLRGADWSMFIAVSIVAGGAAVGLFLGALSGYIGGRTDEIIMRVVDIFLSIPQILFVIMVVTVVTVDLRASGQATTATSIYLLILAFMVVWWPFYTRIVRGQVLVVSEQKYVEAARAAGARSPRVILRHIVPNSMYP